MSSVRITDRQARALRLLSDWSWRRIRTLGVNLTTARALADRGLVELRDETRVAPTGVYARLTPDGSRLAKDLP